MAGPFLSNITNTFFVDLINRLGVRPPPPDGFDLINTVQPVSIVDSNIPLQAIVTTQTLDAPFSAGVQAAPAAGLVLADTGQQIAGTYSVYILVGLRNVVGACDFILARRNAANAADVWRQVFNMPNTGPYLFNLSFTARLLANERIRITEDQLGSATIEANIWLQQIS